MSCVIYVKDTIWKQITTYSIFNFRSWRLCYLCQRYNLKANHNLVFQIKFSAKVVLSMSKIQSESKSQPLQNTTQKGVSCVIYVKDTIWKQITTHMGHRLWNDTVVLSMSKIQSESKSQLRVLSLLVYPCCVIYVKDTIWKQITTRTLTYLTRYVLCYLCQTCLPRACQQVACRDTIWT